MHLADFRNDNIKKSNENSTLSMSIRESKTGKTSLDIWILHKQIPE